MQLFISYFCNIDWSVFANVIGAFANLGFLVLGLLSIKYILRQVRIAQDQIQQTKNITEADIIIRLNSNYFTEETKNLIFLIENNLLKYIHVVDNQSNIDYKYFEIDNIRILKFPNLQKYLMKKNIFMYTSSDIEHLILNNFEDIGIMKKNNMIKKGLIIENFGYYIVCTCNNPSINQYLKDIRSIDKSWYCYMVELYNEFKSPSHLEL